MGQKVLGLDIGSHSIKGAVFDLSFGSFMLTDLYESSSLAMDELLPEDRLKAQGEALKNLVKENSISPHTTICALSGIQISTRMISLPFEKRRFKKVLPFEIEQYLPFPLDELIIDYHTISTDKGQTTALAVAVKKDLIANFLAMVKAANLDPKMLDIDSFALLNAYHNLNLPDAQNYALIDMGHSKTSISIISRGNLEFTRTLLTGGRTLTNALRMKLDLTYDQAEEVKIRHGYLEAESSPALKPDIKKISDILREGIDPLIEEIKQSFQSFKAQRTTEEKISKSVEAIYLCGGTSLLRNIENYFSYRTGVKCSFLQCFPPEHEISRKLGARERILTNAIALGLKVAAKSQKKRLSDINLRKDKFTFQHEYKDLRGHVSFVGRWLLVLIAFVVMGFAVKSCRLGVKEAKIDKEVLKIFSETVVDWRDATPPSSEKALSIMRERVEKFKEQMGVLTAGLNELSALNILREISARIPKDVTVDMQELNISRNNISFRGETDSFASVDKIISSLAQYEPFTTVEKGEISDSTEGNKKKFSVNITVGEKEKEEYKP